MPIVEFSSLPDDARVWVFASQRALAPTEADRLLAAVDEHLDGWAAHGAPLSSARAFRENRFLIVAVDERAAGASGCSIDGLYRALRRMETELGVVLTAGGQVFARDESGAVRSFSRADFIQAASDGRITADTPVFDTSVTSMKAFRGGFETEAGRAWHARLLEKATAQR